MRNDTLERMIKSDRKSPLKQGTSRFRRLNFFGSLQIKTYLCGSKANHSGMTIKELTRLRETEGQSGV
jgi:hypothetical protein